MSDKLSEKTAAIEEARALYNNKWPERLTSGVMYFSGQRITKVEFETRNVERPDGTQTIKLDDSAYVDIPKFVQLYRTNIEETYVPLAEYRTIREKLSLAEGTLRNLRNKWDLVGAEMTVSYRMVAEVIQKLEEHE